VKVILGLGGIAAIQMGLFALVSYRANRRFKQNVINLARKESKVLTKEEFDVYREVLLASPTTHRKQLLGTPLAILAYYRDLASKPKMGKYANSCVALISAIMEANPGTGSVALGKHLEILKERVYVETY
jgi:hypothetical protein